MVGKAVASPAPCADYGYHAQRANVSIIRTSERRASGRWKKVRPERESSPRLVVFLRLIIFGWAEVDAEQLLGLSP